MPLLNFLRYNNAVPVAVSVLLLGGGAAFAASDPQSVYSSTSTVVAVDNTYLAGKDLSHYTPMIVITGVTEDTDSYYVAYTLSTIDLKDDVWQDVQRNETMQVSKADLGQYRDLGVYATERMKAIVDRDLQRLKDTQDDVKKHVSQKTVATQYSGLIGKFLDTKTESLPGYSPVVQPAPEPAGAAPAGVPSGDSVSSANLSVPNPQPVTDQPAQSAPAASGSGPVLKTLGNNPTDIPKGSTYSDMGAIITQPFGLNVGIHVFLDGVEVPQISLDTSVVADYTITYKATDTSGNTGTATRTVHVFDPYAQQGASSTVTEVPTP